MKSDKYIDNAEHIDRRFGPTILALKNKTTIYIFTALLIFFGMFSYNKMPRELMPEIVVPYIFIHPSNRKGAEGHAGG
jgi:multidrug efflux pump